MSKKIKAGVVGVGHMGREHARLYSQLDNVEFMGVYDIDPEVARRISTQHSRKPFSSIGDLANACEAVSIATPTVSHFELGEFFLRQGKHVLMEKPITNSPTEAKQLVEMAHANNAILQVGHIERFNPALHALETVLTRPKFIESHRLSPYPGRSTDIGVVLDMMIHDLEIILHLVNSPIETMDSVGVAVLSKGEDIANTRLRFANGCVANITCSRISPDKLRKIRIFQDDTYISLDYQNQGGEIYRKVKSQITRESITVEKDEPLKLELRSFIDCVGAQGNPVVGGSQAALALDVAMQITEQIWANTAKWTESE
ncbi:MAG: Gfo/Idh/MocA family oxidoreductase [Verrucomicrobiota bacterium]